MNQLYEFLIRPTAHDQRILHSQGSDYPPDSAEKRMHAKNLLADDSERIQAKLAAIGGGEGDRLRGGLYFAGVCKGKAGWVDQVAGFKGWIQCAVT